jgi:CO/xanthine dehydrogenase Mo-binding subunit
MGIIGQSTPHIEVAGKVTGDPAIPMCCSRNLWAKSAEPSFPRASPALTHRRRKRARRARRSHRRRVRHFHGRRYQDVPVLAQARSFIGERVAAVAADDPAVAQERWSLFTLTMKNCRPFRSRTRAARGRADSHPDLNSYRTTKPRRARRTCSLMTSGNTAISQWGSPSDVVVENTFTVSRQHQAFLQPHCCMVWIRTRAVQVWSPNKVPQD